MNQQEKDEYAVMIQDLRDELDRHDIQECVKRYEKQERELTESKEAHAAKVQELECANMVLEQNLQLKATEYNDLYAKHESLL